MSRYSRWEDIVQYYFHIEGGDKDLFAGDNCSYLLRLQGLGSGSNGNCFALNTAIGTLLIDAGISRKRIMAGLRSLGIAPSTVKGILITHAHGDHINGLAVLSSYLDFRVIATPDTIEEIRKKESRDRRFGLVADQAIPLPVGGTLEVSNYTIQALPATHDIVGSCGFHIKFGNQSLSYTTDTSSVGNDFQELMRDSDYVILESNHNRKMLENSRRPTWLKRRIRETHLSNDEALDVIKNVVSPKTKIVALAHLSGVCNSPEEVMRQVHEYHLESENSWDWVVCTREEKSSLISQIRQTLKIDGGLNNRIVNDLDFDLEPPKFNLDRFF